MRYHWLLIVVYAAVCAGCANSTRALMASDDATPLVEASSAAAPATPFPESYEVVLASWNPDEDAPLPPALPDEEALPVLDESAPPAPDESADVDAPPVVVPGDIPPPEMDASPRLTRCGPAPCGSGGPCRNLRGWYVGATFDLGPGIGGGLEVGKIVQHGCSAFWSVELAAQHHDLWEELVGETQTGKFNQVRVGMRVLTNPYGRRHGVFRAGLTWFQVSGTPFQVDISNLEIRDDYVGAYAGVGYQWDVGGNWSHGPEAKLYLGYGVGAGEFAVVPSFSWHFNYNL